MYSLLAYVCRNLDLYINCTKFPRQFHAFIHQKVKPGQVDILVLVYKSPPGWLLPGEYPESQKTGHKRDGLQADGFDKEERPLFPL